MSVYYNLAARKNPHDPDAPKKVYAYAVSAGTLTMEELCAAAERTCTATRGDIKGVALAFAKEIGKSLAAGNSVYLEDLGYFRIGICSGGADTEEDYNPAVHVKDVHLCYQPKGRLVEMKGEVTFEKIVTRHPVSGEVKA